MFDSHELTPFYKKLNSAISKIDDYIYYFGMNKPEKLMVREALKLF